MQPEQDQPPITESSPQAAAAPASGQMPTASDGTPAGAAPASEQPAGDELQRLLEQARAKADEHWDKFVRASAELDNARRRYERELDNARKYALDRFVAELLPVRDSLELGLAAAADPQAGTTKLREGMELTVKLFGDVLQKFGVEAVDPAGSPFDPNLHQALSTQPREDLPANTVTAVVQKGYTLNGRLVRPALVMVSRPGGQPGIDEKA
jgi:molecular chaperone GrpE